MTPWTGGGSKRLILLERGGRQYIFQSTQPGVESGGSHDAAYEKEARTHQAFRGGGQLTDVLPLES